jgi:iron(III) transport system ATP-binding protein
MSDVAITGLCKAYGSQPVLRAVDLYVPDGSITSVLGASGCGKTTLLRIVAGFVRSDAGSVTIGGRLVEDPVTSVAPQHRGVGYVPQEGALFPHLDVAANILFGLPRRARTKARLAEMLEIAELSSSLTGRYPHELSGGQQQRVALARALAPAPTVVLLDEPFSSLDARLRVSAGREVARVLRHAEATALIVTHDQGEALSLADQVAVMREGRFVQVASPSDVYDAPADPATAEFVGGGSVIEAEVRGGTAKTAAGVLVVLPLVEGAARLFVRPEQVAITAPGDGPTATVADVDFYGAQVVVHLVLDVGMPLTARGPASRPPSVGDVVGIEVQGTVRGFPADA